jgi:hypothetical protein
MLAYAAADWILAKRTNAGVSPSIKTCADEKRLDKPISDRMWALYDQITLSPPVSLASAAVKLRLLADPDLVAFRSGRECYWDQHPENASPPKE